MLFLYVFWSLWTFTSFVTASTHYPTSQPTDFPSSQPISKPSKLPTPSPTAPAPPIISTLVNQRGLAGSDGIITLYHPTTSYPILYHHTTYNLSLFSLAILIQPLTTLSSDLLHHLLSHSFLRGWWCCFVSNLRSTI